MEKPDCDTCISDKDCCDEGLDCAIYSLCCLIWEKYGKDPDKLFQIIKKGMKSL